MAWTIDANGNLVEVEDGSIGTTMGVDSTYGTPPVQKVTPKVDAPPEQSGLAALWGDTKNFFTPQKGQKTSVGNNMMDAIGTGIQAGTGLAGLYLTNKTNKANQALAERELANSEKQAKYLRSRDAGMDANKQAFAANVGGGASYVGSK